MRVDTSDKRFQQFCQIMTGYLHRGPLKPSEIRTRDNQSSLDGDPRKMYKVFVPLYSVLYDERFGKKAKYEEDISNATKAFELVLNRLFLYTPFFDEKTNIANTYLALIKIYTNPNYTNKLIGYLNHFHKVEGLFTVVDRLVNEASYKSKNKIAGGGGELYHAAELEKLGYRIVCFGFTSDNPGKTSKEQLVEVDLVVERGGVYSFVEVKHIAGRKEFGNAFASPAEYVSKYFLETENGTSKKLKKLKTFIDIVRSNDDVKKRIVIKSLRNHFPNDGQDLQNLIKQIETSETPFPLIISYPYTAGISLTYDANEIILKDGTRIAADKPLEALPEHAIRNIAEDISIIDRTLWDSSDSAITISTNKVPFELLNRSTKVIPSFRVASEGYEGVDGMLNKRDVALEDLILDFMRLLRINSKGQNVPLSTLCTDAEIKAMMSSNVELRMYPKSILETSKAGIIEKIEKLHREGVLSRIIDIPKEINIGDVANGVADFIKDKDAVITDPQMADLVIPICNAITLRKLNIENGEIDEVNEESVMHRLLHLAFYSTIANGTQEEIMWNTKN